ncbi:MAG: M20/M25/M40 family metallo-hydrolase, partial [Bacteroidota bacterium]
VKQEALDALAALDLPGATLDVAYDERFLEGIHNDPELTDLLRDAVARHAGDVSVQTVSQVIPMFSEDFGSFQARTPGVMVFLGVSNPVAGTVGMPHTPDYVADDGAILVGARAMFAAMMARLGR